MHIMAKGYASHWQCVLYFVWYPATRRGPERQRPRQCLGHYVFPISCPSPALSREASRRPAVIVGLHCLFLPSSARRDVTKEIFTKDKGKGGLGACQTRPQVTSSCAEQHWSSQDRIWNSLGIEECLQFSADFSLKDALVCRGCTTDSDKYRERRHHMV